MASTACAIPAGIVGEIGCPPPSGVTVARFDGFDGDGRFRVVLPDGDEPLCALSTVGLTATDAGTDVVVAYEHEGRGRLIIIGRVHERVAVPPESELRVDGRRVVIRAAHDLELRCGEASIVLTRAGKVLIKGSYVLTRSRGANRIKGAYVDIN